MVRRKEVAKLQALSVASIVDHLIDEGSFPEFTLMCCMHGWIVSELKRRKKLTTDILVELGYLFEETRVRCYELAFFDATNGFSIDLFPNTWVITKLILRQEIGSNQIIIEKYDLMRLIEELPEIQILDLTGLGRTVDDLALIGIAENCHQLAALTITNNHTITPYGLQNFCYLKRKAEQMYPGVLERFQSLSIERCLAFSSSSFQKQFLSTRSSIRAIFDILATFPNLHTLASNGVLISLYAFYLHELQHGSPIFPALKYITGLENDSDDDIEWNREAAKAISKMLPSVLFLGAYVNIVPDLDVFENLIGYNCLNTFSYDRNAVATYGRHFLNYLKSYAENLKFINWNLYVSYYLGIENDIHRELPLFLRVVLVVIDGRCCKTPGHLMAVNELLRKCPNVKYLYLDFGWELDTFGMALLFTNPFQKLEKLVVSNVRKRSVSRFFQVGDKFPVLENFYFGYFPAYNDDESADNVEEDYLNDIIARTGLVCTAHKVFDDDNRTIEELELGRISWQYVVVN